MKCVTNTTVYTCGLSGRGPMVQAALGQRVSGTKTGDGSRGPGEAAVCTGCDGSSCCCGRLCGHPPRVQVTADQPSPPQLHPCPETTCSATALWAAPMLGTTRSKRTKEAESARGPTASPGQERECRTGNHTGEHTKTRHSPAAWGRTGACSRK